MVERFFLLPTSFSRILFALSQLFFNGHRTNISALAIISYEGGNFFADIKFKVRIKMGEKLTQTTVETLFSLKMLIKERDINLKKVGC